MNSAPPGGFSSLQLANEAKIVMEVGRSVGYVWESIMWGDGGYWQTQWLTHLVSAYVHTYACMFVCAGALLHVCTRADAGQRITCVLCLRCFVPFV